MLILLSSFKIPTSISCIWTFPWASRQASYYILHLKFYIYCHRWTIYTWNIYLVLKSLKIIILPPSNSFVAVPPTPTTQHWHTVSELGKRKKNKLARLDLILAPLLDEHGDDHRSSSTPLPPFPPFQREIHASRGWPMRVAHRRTRCELDRQVWWLLASLVRAGWRRVLRAGSTSNSLMLRNRQQPRKRAGVSRIISA